MSRRSSGILMTFFRGSESRTSSSWPSSSSSASSPCRSSGRSTRTRAARSPGWEGSRMLIEFPILTYIVLLPAVGAVFTYLTGSDRAARAVALAFSLIVLGLSTVLLMGFLWTNVISLPTITTAGNHTYFAVEKTPWVPSLNINYILGVDALSVVLVFLNALLTPLALAHVRHDAGHRHDAEPRGDDRGPDVRRPPNRVRHETPDVAVAHMAARRPRRGSHRRLRHPGGSPPEARRLRVDPLQRPDDSAGRGRHVLAPRAGRSHLDPLRRGRVPRPGRPEAARRVLEREPHGVRDPRDRRRGVRLHGERPRGSPRLLGRDFPDVRSRPRVRGPVHGRGLARPQDRYAEHLGARRDREAGAAHGDVHHDLLHGVPRPPRPGRVRRRVHRVHRRLRRVRPACFRSDPDGRLDGGVLDLGDAARDLRPSESEMGDDAGPASVRGRTARRPRGVVRRLRDRAGLVPLLPIELGPGDSRRPLTCPATASSSRRRSSSPRPSPPRSSGSRGGSG